MISFLEMCRGEKLKLLSSINQLAKLLLLGILCPHHLRSVTEKRSEYIDLGQLHVISRLFIGQLLQSSSESAQSSLISVQVIEDLTGF